MRPSERGILIGLALSLSMWAAIALGCRLVMQALP